MKTKPTTNLQVLYNQRTVASFWKFPPHASHRDTSRKPLTM
ncbi:MAG: hypothetical protein SGI92_16875 [Bryobacteraceae bacterium]|nr:hypothetical protein [Bryobacteraceae bacterium]